MANQQKGPAPFLRIDKYSWVLRHSSNFYAITDKKAEFIMNEQLRLDFEPLKSGLASSILLNTVDNTKNVVLKSIDNLNRIYERQFLWRLMLVRTDN